MAVIEIYVDQVWTGSGKLARREGGYRIEDCGAQFCDDNDESLEVYDSIEEAIEAGKKSITVELDGESKKITWTVTGSDWQCFDRLSGETFEVCGDDEHSVRSAVETYIQDGIDTDTGEVDYDVVATAHGGRSYSLSGTVSPVDDE
jgi:hypothetical protein